MLLLYASPLLLTGTPPPQKRASVPLPHTLPKLLVEKERKRFNAKNLIAASLTGCGSNAEETTYKNEVRFPGDVTQSSLANW